MAAGMVMGGSVFVVLSVIEQMRSLRSIESREGIEEFLSRPPGSGLGLDVEGVISILHVTSMVAAGCATAAAILGWHVLKRDLKARVALSIIAVPLFISGLVTGGFISSLVAASVVVLWMPPARDWFRFGTWTPPASRDKRAADATRTHAPPAGQPPAPWQHPSTGAQEPEGERPQGPTPQGPTPQGPPPQQAPYGMPHQPGHDPAGRREAAMPSERPKALVLAFVLTVVFAVMAGLMAGLSAVAMLVAPDLIMDELTRQRPDIADQGVTPALLRATTLALGALVVVWSIAAVVLGTLALLGRDWARLGLMISAIATAVACLLMAFGAPFLLVPGAAAVVTAVNLRRSEVRAWCRSQGHRTPTRDGMWS